MINIQEATSEDLHIIREIAYKTWPHTFGDILSAEQISYMLEWMYSIPSLTEQVKDKGHTFLLAREGTQHLGFASYELNNDGESATKIHKIYVLPDTQGRGIGKALISRISDIARQQRNTALKLNVNRYNPAVKFYENLGFKIISQDNIPIGNGFFMEDYSMKKELGLQAE